MKEAKFNEERDKKRFYELIEEQSQALDGPFTLVEGGKSSCKFC